MALLLAQAATAAEPPAPAEVTPFRILDTGGELFARGRFQRNDQTTGSFKQTQSETYAEEGVDARARGYAYHPNLLEWDAGVRAGLLQDFLTVNGNQFDTTGTLLGFNVSTLWFKEKPVSFRLFASQSEDTHARDFAPSVQTQNQRFGGEVYTKGPFPASLLLEGLRDRETGGFRTVDRDTRHARFAIADQRNPDWLTQLVYDLQDISETDTFTSPGSPTATEQFPSRIHDLSLTNLYKFGPPRAGIDKHTLAGQARILDQTGFFQQKDFLIDERLDLNHTESFSTFYHVMYDNNEVLGRPDKTITGEAGFLKRIYKSLDVTGRVFGTDHTFEGGSEKIAGGYLDLDYRKRTPIGQYLSTMTLGLEDEEQTTSGTLPVLNEPVTLNGVAFTPLARPNVQPGSIVVTDAAGTTTFFEGLDFVVDTLGAFTRIARLLPTTSIADGQTVRVRYTVTGPRQATFTTSTFNWNNRLNLKNLPLSLYVNYHSREQELTSGLDPGNLDKVHDLLGGAEVNYKNLLVTLEHEIRDQLLSPPSVADRARASYRHPFSRQLDATVGAQGETIRFRDAAKFGLEPGKDRLQTIGAFLDVTGKLRANSLLRFRSDYLQTTGQQNSKLFRNGIAWEWVYEKLEFSVELRHDIFEQEITTGSTDVLMFTMRRRF